jgi:protein arginine kinase activator
MLCQHCGQNEATRHYQTTVNGETRQTHLCAACTASTGFETEFQKSVFSFDIPALMSEMLGLRSQRPGGVCPACGLRLEELSRSGQVGCADCYRHFAPALAP